MSCKYKDECPSYSGWCEGPKQDFSNCVSFLITAYENAKKEADDLLVVRVNVILRQRDYNQLYNTLLEQKKIGTVLLPHYCEAILVPNNEEVVLTDKYGKVIGNGNKVQ